MEGAAYSIFRIPTVLVDSHYPFNNEHSLKWFCQKMDKDMVEGEVVLLLSHIQIQELNMLFENTKQGGIEIMYSNLYYAKVPPEAKSRYRMSFKLYGRIYHVV